MSFGCATDYCEEGLLRLLFGKASPVPSGEVYLAVGTADADDGSSDTWSAEISGGGYQRHPIYFYPITSGVIIKNVSNVVFPKATANWGTITSYAIWTAQTGGKMLVYGGLTSVIINSGDILRVPKDAIAIDGYDAPGANVSRYLYRKLLNHLLAKQSYSSPSIYVALAGTTPGHDTTGSELNEPSGNGYARKAWSSWNDPVQQVDPAEVTNSGGINFNAATGDWTPSIVAAVLVDASSGGNVLCWGDSSGSVYNGDTAHFDDAAINVGLT
ncbi:MAG: hypothetical protein HYS12_22415 [Planctomycetes bacterium]|nr:hypothetical protein [Planctomycetota bacterium]